MVATSKNVRRNFVQDTGTYSSALSSVSTCLFPRATTRALKFVAQQKELSLRLSMALVGSGGTEDEIFAWCSQVRLGLRISNTLSTAFIQDACPSLCKAAPPLESFEVIMASKAVTDVDLTGGMFCERLLQFRGGFFEALPAESLFDLSVSIQGLHLWNKSVLHSQWSFISWSWFSAW